MAVVFSNNATTVLSSNITNSATSIAVQDGSVFPTLSGTDYFYATLQDPGNTKREIVKVTARSGNTLTVTRAVDGSSASAFSANDAFELRLNAAALNDAVNSGTADLELNSFTGDGSEVDFTLSMEALEANTLVYIDGVYQNKTAYSISGYVLTFSAAPDNGAAIEVTTATVAPIQESTDFLLNQFTGDGSDTTFTLSSAPEENQTTVFISGVYQSKSNYSISGTTLTFSTAPPASSSIEVMVARTVVYGIGTPSNDTVSTAKIVDGAVTPAKLSLTYATETFVGTAVSNLVDSSPAALDTLNELAAALGDDPNFATTVTNSIALKAPLASPSFTGDVDTSGLLKVGTNDSEYANNYIRFKSTGAAYIDHGTVGQAINFRVSGSSSLDTTPLSIDSTGIDVTGTATMDGLTVDGDAVIASAVPRLILSETDVTNGNWDFRGSFGNLTIRSLNDDLSTAAPKMLIGANGDIAFYEDTGTTPKFYWDASAESLGIGTSSPFFTTGGRSSLSVNGSSSSILAFGKGGSSENYILADAGGFTIANTSATLPTTFFNNGAERVRITSAGRVGINTADIPPNSWLTVEGGAYDLNQYTMHLRSYTPSLVFQDVSTAATDFEIQADSGALMFRYGDASTNVQLASEAMRISAGNLLVGQTANAETGTGIGLVPDGTSHMYSGSTDALMLGRGGNDGDILSFNKSGTTVGSIGVTGTNDIEIHSTTANHTGLRLGEGYYIPTNNTGATADNAVDLGLASIRYKDLYLSGGVYLGGTGAANKLDDYEEGTFTPTFVNIGNGTYAVQNGRYTKIGNQCTCYIYLSISVFGTASGSIVVGGLPFNALNVGGVYGSTSAVHGTGWTTPTAGLQGLVSPGSTTVTFYENMTTTSSPSAYTTNMADIGTGNLLFSITYKTA